MPMFPSVSLLHAQVAAKMRARELNTKVGALIYVTRAEMVERGRPVNDGIQDLNSDIRAQFVYADPVTTRETATEARKHAGLPGGSVLLAIADRLDKEADINEKRAAGKDPATIEAQVNYSTSFFKFKNDWDEFYHDLVHSDTTTLSEFLGNELPDKIDHFRAQYLTQYVGFQGLGGKPNKPPPPASNAGDVHIPNPITAATKAVNDIPFGKIGLALAGAAALYWVLNRPKSVPSAPALPERRVGPPDRGYESEEAALARAHL